jgi:GDP-mannose 6-dehydrogenase
MKISVFGMGYVGSVTAACFAAQGHTVVGVDVNPNKVRMINEGQAPLVEPSLGDLIAENVRAGRLRATTDASEAVQATGVSLVCVGTPSLKSGRLDLSGVERVAASLGAALAGKRDFHTIAIRSTILPGTIDTLVLPTLEARSGRRAGADFAVCYNPEFMREGTAVSDFYAPPLTVIGAHDPADARPVAELYAFLKTPVTQTDIRSAEMLKYVCNIFHALKIAFANEIGTLAKAAGVDSHTLMRLFCSDEKLNISRAYLEPGFAFGGSCLPKDLRAILYRARELDLKLPVLEAILPSNELHIERAIEMVVATERKRIGVLGLSFKANTDDLRESPMVAVVKSLLGEGCQVKIFDPQVNLSAIMGANKEFLESTIPHISALLEPALESVVRESEVLVLGRDAKEFPGLPALLRPEHVVIQLQRSRSLEGKPGKQVGLCW